MMKLESLPENAYIIDENKYYYEIDNQLNHVVCKSEYFVIYEGRRYVCGYIDNREKVESDNLARMEELKQLVNKLFEMSSFGVGAFFSSMYSHQLSSVSHVALNVVALGCVVGFATRAFNIVPMLTKM